MPRAFDYFYGTPMYHGYTRDVDLARFIPEMMRNREVIESPADVDLLTREYTEETIGFIRDNRDKPFFIYLAHHMPHLPLGASSGFKGKSQPAGLYGDAMEELDWSMGEIFRELERLQLDDRTLVIYLSDNGPRGRPQRRIYRQRRAPPGQKILQLGGRCAGACHHALAREDPGINSQ